jgi:hypothetical protein
MGEGEEAIVNPFDLIEELVRRHPGKTVLALLALGFAWFVWPTPYRAIGPGGLMQVNRFTGVRCDVGESCWRKPRASRPEGCRDWVDTGKNTVTDLICRGGPSK